MDLPMKLTHLQRLEAESIHIMREVVAEIDKPRHAVLDRQGQRGHAAPGQEGVLSVAAAVSAAARRHDVEVPCDVRDARAHGQRARHGPAHLPEPRSGRRWASIRSTTARRSTPTCGRPRASNRRSTCTVSMRPSAAPAAMREVAREGAHLLVPLGAAPLGSEEPAARALASLQRPQAQGRVDPRLPDLELDRARHLASTSISRTFPSCRSTSRPRGRSSSATAR